MAENTDWRIELLNLMIVINFKPSFTSNYIFLSNGEQAEVDFNNAAVAM